MSDDNATTTRSFSVLNPVTTSIRVCVFVCELHRTRLSLLTINILDDKNDFFLFLLFYYCLLLLLLRFDDDIIVRRRRVGERVTNNIIFQRH